MHFLSKLSVGKTYDFVLVKKVCYVLEIVKNGNMVNLSPFPNINLYCNLCTLVKMENFATIVWAFITINMRVHKAPHHFPYSKKMY